MPKSKLRAPRRARNAFVRHGAVAAFAAAALAAGAAPANALVLNLTFDSTITSLANASLIENDMKTVAGWFNASLSSPVTVNVKVSWGSVGGTSMGPGNLGSSLDNLYGYFSYSQIKNYITAAAAKAPTNKALTLAAAHLTSAGPGGTSQYVISSAEAKALGLISATMPGTDGSIGFSKTAVFDFNPSDGIASNAYDFEAVAAHEMEEILGRISGLTSSSPTFRTPLDLYRYAAAGSPSWSYSGSAYASLDGGVTHLGTYNNLSGGDRSDWLSSTTGVGDVQAAFATMGKTAGVSAADLSLLDALGWGGANMGSTSLLTPTAMAKSFMGDGVPEPSTWAMLILGVGLVGATLRRRRETAAA